MFGTAQAIRIRFARLLFTPFPIPHRRESVPATLSALARCAAILIAAPLLAFSARHVAAATNIYEWLGYTSGDMSGTLTNYWNSTTNATPTQAPNGSDPDIIEFNAPGYYSNLPSMNASFAIGALWFEGDDASGATIGAGGGTLTLNDTTVNGASNVGLYVDAGSGPVTISAPLNVANTQTWINKSINPVSIGGAVDLSGSSTLTIQGSGIGGYNLTGQISGGSGTTLSINDPWGTVVISGNNSGFAGTVTLNATASTLEVENANALGTGKLSLTNVHGTSIDTPLSDLTLTSTSMNDSGNLTFQGTHNLAFGGTLSITGNFGFVLNNSTLQFNGLATNTYTGSTAIYLTPGGENGTVTTGNLILNGGLALSTSGSTYTTFQIDGSDNTTVNGVVSNGGSSTHPSLTIGNFLSGTNNGTTPTSTVYLTGLNTYSGTTIVDGGILSTGPTGTLAASGSASSIGTSGTIALSGQGDNNQGATLQYANTSGTNESSNVQITLGLSSDGSAYGNYIDASGKNQITFSNTSPILYGNTSLAYTLVLTGTGTGNGPGTFGGVFDPMIGNNNGGSTAVSLTKSGTGSWKSAVPKPTPARPQSMPACSRWPAA